MTDLINFINSTGFPIVAFIIMVWLNVRIITKNTEAISELTAHLKDGKSCIYYVAKSEMGDHRP